MNHLRIVFMGTPEFAVGILDSIISNGHNVVGVVTAPDKPAGRGQKIKYSAVKEYALQKDLPILQPVNLKDESFINQLSQLNANLQVVVAFRMLPEIVWKMPQYGTFNLHASLLPQYRGAAPINWAIINGDSKTGVTSFFIDDKIDTGAIILSKEAEILSTENAGALHDKLMNLGSIAVIETLDLIASGNAIPVQQEMTGTFKTANKLNKENCRIDWNAQGKDIFNLIRGLSPYPGAWCYIHDGVNSLPVKVFETEFLPLRHSDKYGTIITDKKTLKIAVSGGYLVINSLQLPGKKKMEVKELLNGMTFSENAHAG